MLCSLAWGSSLPACPRHSSRGPRAHFSRIQGSDSQRRRTCRYGEPVGHLPPPPTQPPGQPHYGQPQYSQQPFAAPAGFSQDCNSDMGGAGILTGIGGPWVVAIPTTVVTIVKIVRRKKAFWVPIVGGILVTVVLGVAFGLSLAAGFARTRRARPDCAGQDESMRAEPFPPQPWFLGGDLMLSSWLVEPDALSIDAWDTLPEGWTPISVGSRLIVGTAFAHYSPGGVLAYEELLVAVMVRRGLRVRVWIPQIWVTSTASMAGGRTLWGIPKHLADLRRTLRSTRAISASMHAPDGEPQVTLEAHLGGPLLPGQWTLPLPTAQHLEGVETLSTNSVTTRIRSIRAKWTFAAHGPLAYLNGKRPLLSLALVPAAITFGRDVRRSHRAPHAGTNS